MRDKKVDGLKLFIKSPAHRTLYTLDDVDLFLVQPLSHSKMKVFYKEGKPAGLVSWAFLSEEQERLYRETGKVDKEVFVQTEGNLWCLDLISDGIPPREILSYMRKLKKKLYPNHDPNVKFIRFVPDTREHRVRL